MGMLNLLHRHVLKEVLVATCLAMGFFIFVLLMGNALRDVAELILASKLKVGIFFRLIGLLIPYVAAYALPLGMLTGTLITLGRLSSQREITAMKSAGISLYQIAAPVFLIAFFGMILGVLINLHYAPKSRLAYKELMARSLIENPVDFIRERRFVHEFPGYVLYMGEREGSTMKDFWIWELDEQKRVSLFLRAGTGDLAYDEVKRNLILTLRDVVAERRDPENPESFDHSSVDTVFFGELPIALSLNQIFGETRKRRLRTKEMTFARLMDRRSQALQKEKESGTTGISEDRLEVQVHIQKNFAMAYSVFSLTIFGIPLAIQVERKETSANLGIALIIAMTYYFLMIMVSWIEENPTLRPDLLIWLPNLIFQGMGFRMIQKANRH